MTNVDREVVRIIGAIHDDDPDVVLLSTDVRLRARRMSRDTYLSILGRFEEPEVPRVYIEDAGRHEENPDDPAYKAGLVRYRIKIANAITAAAYTLGVEIVSIPDGFPAPDDPEWLEERRLAGLSSGDTDRARQLDWLRHKAATGATDNAAIMRAVGRAMGVTEVDAAEATKSAGHSPARNANSRGRR